MQGIAHVYGDNIDTDRIIAGKYTKTLNTQDLVDHVLEDLDPGFRERLCKGDFLVAGENFGCGSSREQAPLALKKAGVGAVVAKSFSRIFFRNSINIGLALVTVPDHKIEQGSSLSFDGERGTLAVLGDNIIYDCAPIPPMMAEIMAAGGLVGFLKNRDSYAFEGGML